MLRSGQGSTAKAKSAPVGFSCQKAHPPNRTAWRPSLAPSACGARRTDVNWRRSSGGVSCSCAFAASPTRGGPRPNARPGPGGMLGAHPALSRHPPRGHSRFELPLPAPLQGAELGTSSGEAKGGWASGQRRPQAHGARHGIRIYNCIKWHDSRPR